MLWHTWRLIAAQRDSQTVPLAPSHPKLAEGFPRRWLQRRTLMIKRTLVPLPSRALIQVPVLPLSPQFCICSNLQKFLEVAAFGLACQHATSGDFTRKRNLLSREPGSAAPARGYGMVLAARAAKLAQALGRKFLFLLYLFQMGTDTVWDRARHVSDWHHAKYLRANISNS